MRKILPEPVLGNVQASPFAYHNFVLPVELGVPKGENEVMSGGRSQRTAEPASRLVWDTQSLGSQEGWMEDPVGGLPVSR